MRNTDRLPTELSVTDTVKLTGSSQLSVVGYLSVHEVPQLTRRYGRFSYVGYRLTNGLRSGVFYSSTYLICCTEISRYYFSKGFAETPKEENKGKEPYCSYQLSDFPARKHLYKL